MNHMQALEKAAADAFPNASKKIESIVKNVSNQTFFYYVLSQLGNF